MRMLHVLGLGIAIAVLGCAAVQCPSTTDPLTRCTEGIPNLRVASQPGAHRAVYRGGQPTPAGWTYLHDTLHVAVDVKLNDPRESFGQGEDSPAAAAGIAVDVHTMHPIDTGDPMELFRGPSLAQAAEAVAAITRSSGPVYVHCSHGRDRTGLIVGLYRVFIEGASPALARQEMDAAGFRPFNRGLDRVRDPLFEDGTPGERALRQASFRALITFATPEVSHGH